MTYYKYDDFLINAQRRFDKHYDKTDSCWNYKHRLNQDGYGHIGITVEGKDHTLRAHRYSWIMANKQDWPADKPVARHSCNNPACVNPEHIIPGTQKENIDDAIRAGTHNTFTGWPKGKPRK